MSKSSGWLSVGLACWLIAFAVLPALSARGMAPLQVVAPAVYVLTLLGSTGLIAWLGLVIGGAPQGVLFTGRNTYSVSRLQMTLWTLVIFSALIAAVVCRAWTSGLEGALQVDIRTELLQAMGISYASAAAAPALLSLKSRAASGDELLAASDRQGETLVAAGQVVGRPNGAPPSLLDLVRGDELANAGTIDLGKVQQLIITLLLAGVYAGVVGAWFAGEAFAAAPSQLPAFSEHLVALMLVSHGGYLVGKAASKPTPALASAEPRRPDPPADRNA